VAVNKAYNGSLEAGAVHKGMQY